MKTKTKEGEEMKAIGIVLLALVGGFIFGLVLTEIVSIVGMMLTDGTMWLSWLRFTPIYLGVLSAIVAFIVMKRKAK